MQSIKELLKNKLDLKDSTIETDQEYFLAVGQGLQYLNSFNKNTKFKNHAYINFLNCKKSEQIEKEINLLVKNNLDNIINNNTKKLFALITSYKTDNKDIDFNILEFAYFSNSILQ